MLVLAAIASCWSRRPRCPARAEPRRPVSSPRARPLIRSSARTTCKTCSQDEARRRLQARERFELLDSTLFRNCFSDWQGEHDHALGGFVFGQLVAAKDELEDHRSTTTRRRSGRHRPRSSYADRPRRTQRARGRSTFDRAFLRKFGRAYTRSIGARAGPNAKRGETRPQRIVNGVTSIGSPGVASLKASRIIRSSWACGLSARPAAIVRSAAFVSPTAAKYSESA